MPPPGPPEIPTDRQSLTQRPKTDETKRKARGQAEECVAHAGARDGAQRPQAGGTERGARGRTGWGGRPAGNGARRPWVRWGGTRSPQAGGTRRDALAGGWSGVRRPWAGGAECKTSSGPFGGPFKIHFWSVLGLPNRQKRLGAALAALWNRLAFGLVSLRGGILRTMSSPLSMNFSNGTRAGSDR